MVDGRVAAASPSSWLCTQWQIIFAPMAQIIFAPLTLGAFSLLVTGDLLDVNVAGLSPYGHDLVRCCLMRCSRSRPPELKRQSSKLGL